MIRLLIIVLMLGSIGCTKIEKGQTAKATIVLVKYSCGASCTAATYVLKTDSAFLLPTSNLPIAFQKHQLPVTIEYKLTGQFPAMSEGPENVEIVELYSIRLR